MAEYSILNQAQNWDPNKYPRAGDSWSREEFRILTLHSYNEDKTEPIKGWTLRPFFGAHRSDYWQSWILTHLPSGRRIGATGNLATIKRVVNWILRGMERTGEDQAGLIFTERPESSEVLELLYQAGAKLKAARWEGVDHG